MLAHRCSRRWCEVSAGVRQPVLGWRHVSPTHLVRGRDRQASAEYLHAALVVNTEELTAPKGSDTLRVLLVRRTGSQSRAPGLCPARPCTGANGWPRPSCARRARGPTSKVPAARTCHTYDDHYRDERGGGPSRSSARTWPPDQPRVRRSAPPSASGIIAPPCLETKGEAAFGVQAPAAVPPPGGTPEGCRASS
jgi:hypothetical protein